MFKKYWLNLITYGTDFSHFGGGSGGVIVVKYLNSVFTDRFNGSYAHSFLVIIVVSLFLADEDLVAVAGKVWRWFDDPVGCRLRCRFPFSLFVLFRQGSFFCFLENKINFRWQLHFLSNNLRATSCTTVIDNIFNSRLLGSKKYFQISRRTCDKIVRRSWKCDRNLLRSLKGDRTLLRSLKGDRTLLRSPKGDRTLLRSYNCNRTLLRGNRGHRNTSPQL